MIASRRVTIAEIIVPISDYAKTLAAEAQAIKSSADRKKGFKAVAKRGDVNYWINPYSIEVRPEARIRNIESAETKAHIAALTQSINEIGFINPLIVFLDGNTPVLLDGECRLRAFITGMDDFGLGFGEVPVKLVPKGSGEIDRLLMRIALNSAKNLDAAERDRAFKQAAEFGISSSDVIRRTAMSEAKGNDAIDPAVGTNELKSADSIGQSFEAATSEPQGETAKNDAAARNDRAKKVGISRPRKPSRKKAASGPASDDKE